MEAIGIDYALLYPTLGLTAFRCPDDELPTLLARSLNSYYAETFAEFRDQLEPVVFIPMFNPHEAVEELHHAVGELGLKAITMSGSNVYRVEGTNGRVGACVETVGLDCAEDHEPVWRTCADLRVTPTFHGTSMGYGTRASLANYVYNHLGSFAAAREGVCRSLIMGGVPQRHPELNIAFL